MGAWTDKNFSFAWKWSHLKGILKRGFVRCLRAVGILCAVDSGGGAPTLEKQKGGPGKPNLTATRNRGTRKVNFCVKELENVAVV